MLLTLGTQRVPNRTNSTETNWLIKRWHRSFIAAAENAWENNLGLPLLGLRNAVKQEVKASALEMLLGTSTQFSVEFFISKHNIQPNRIFCQKLRRYCGGGHYTLNFKNSLLF